METKEYYATGKPVHLKYGEVYENLNGTKYVCVSRFWDSGDPLLQTAKASCFGGKYTVWEFIARGVQMYEDGRIDWAHSTDGSFQEPVFDWQK